MSCTYKLFISETDCKVCTFNITAINGCLMGSGSLNHSCVEQRVEGIRIEVSYVVQTGKAFEANL